MKVRSPLSGDHDCVNGRVYSFNVIYALIIDVFNAEYGIGVMQ